MTTLAPPANTRSVPNPARLRSLRAVLETAALLLLLLAGMWRMGTAPFLAFSLAGAFATHLMFRPARQEIAAAILSGAAFALLYFLMRFDTGKFVGSALAIPSALLGLGTLFTLGSRWIWAPAAEKWRRFERARDAALVPLLCLGPVLAVGPAIGFTPLTYDRVLYLFDAKFGVPPAWWIGRVFVDHNFLKIACSFVYNSLPLAIAVCLALQWQDRRRKRWYSLDLRWLSMALGGVGFLLYQICPAAGPLYLFQSEFPRVIPNLAAILATPVPIGEFPRNGMPSLHVAWTMLLFWNIRNRGWWLAAPAVIYAGMTALATLGLGEHYLMDLIVAAPLALALQAFWLRTQSSLRWIAIALGTAGTFGWLLAMRSGLALALPAGFATWLAVGATVLAPVAIAWCLEKGIGAHAAAHAINENQSPGLGNPVRRDSLATESLELS